MPKRLAILVLCTLSIFSLMFESSAARGRWHRRNRCRSACCVTVSTLPADIDTVPTARPTREIVSASGRRYRLYQSSEQDPLGFGDEPAALFGAAQRWDGTDGETFAGLSRRNAKTSVSGGSMATFSRLNDLLDSLPSDSTMRSPSAGIARGADSDRVQVENKNVTVDAWLYAASYEDDNDFHLIIGNRARAGTRFMNVEVSGIPLSGMPDRDVLMTVRDQFEDVFDGVPGDAYMFADPPIPVRVSGSLFFDIDHAAGGVGPGSLRNRIRTAWEIHPITNIELND